MTFTFTGGNQEATYREATNKQTIVINKSKTCPGCRRQRSPAQFDEGRKTCKKNAEA